MEMIHSLATRLPPIRDFEKGNTRCVIFTPVTRKRAILLNVWNFMNTRFHHPPDGETSYIIMHAHGTPADVSLGQSDDFSVSLFLICEFPGGVSSQLDHKVAGDYSVDSDSRCFKCSFLRN